MMQRREILVISIGTILTLIHEFISVPEEISFKIYQYDHGETSNCSCFLRNSGIDYDFCYRLPFDKSIVGKKFQCAHLGILERFGLLNMSAALDTESDRMPDPEIVLAFSENHANEGKFQISKLRDLFPNRRLHIYDLGFSENTKKELKKLCNVEVRDFPFHIYPQYVQNLEHYRWKPLIIAEMLKEFGAIWYLDTSVILLSQNISYIEDTVRCKFKSHHLREAHNCTKFSYLLHSPSGHGIFSTTTPGMYDYFPSNMELLKTKRAEVFQAGFAFIVRTKETLEVLKWYVLCALERNCMAPYGHRLNCRFGDDQFQYYAGCHRYDQSAINLLLFNQNDYDNSFYISGSDDFFTINRTLRAYTVTGPKCG